jgi:hypothetical protein
LRQSEIRAELLEFGRIISTTTSTVHSRLIRHSLRPSPIIHPSRLIVTVRIIILIGWRSTSTGIVVTAAVMVRVVWWNSISTTSSSSSSWIRILAIHGFSRVASTPCVVVHLTGTIVIHRQILLLLMLLRLRKLLRLLLELRLRLRGQ